MSKPTLPSPGPLAVPPFKRGTDNDSIGLRIKDVQALFEKAGRTNQVEDWSAVDQAVLELKHFTHLKFLEVRQSIGTKCEVCHGKH